MKKIQKQYQRKIKISQNNDVFTTFQRHSTSNCSSNKIQKSHKSRSFHQNQHEHIQSLKNTLKSLIPVSMQMTKNFQRNIGISSIQSQQQMVQNDQYKLKLDQLTKNLEQIASKCHFSPANVNNSKYDQSSFNRKEGKAKPLFQKSQTLSRYEPIQSELFYRYSNNTSIQLVKNKSQSFLDKQDYHRSFHYKSPIKLQNQAKNISNIEIYKSKEKSMSKSKFNDVDSNRKKSFSKKEVINQTLGTTSENKNLAKLFETIDNQTMDIFKGRERSQTQFKKYETVFKEKIHRSKITNILITDQIYTSSLDYFIKKTSENHEAKYESTVVQNFRGGVEYIGVLNNKIYGCGRDYYLRSVDGNYFYRFDKIPISFCQTQKQNSININFSNNELKLFDLQKRQFLSTILIQNNYALFSKVTKENYVGLKNSLFALDWRKREHLVNVYKDLYKDNITWLSDPFSKTFWYHQEGELTILNQDLKKKGTKNIPFHFQFVNYHWGRNGLNILSQQGQGGFKVHHYQEFKQRQQLDSEYQSSQLTNLLIRDKQLIYCSKSGQLIIKSKK